MNTNITRRRFLESTSLAGAGLSLGLEPSLRAAEIRKAAGKPGFLTKTIQNFITSLTRVFASGLGRKILQMLLNSLGGGKGRR